MEEVVVNFNKLVKYELDENDFKFITSFSRLPVEKNSILSLLI